MVGGIESKAISLNIGIELGLIGTELGKKLAENSFSHRKAEGLLNTWQNLLT